MNKYKKWYDEIVHRAQLRDQIAGYTERHHIVPKCMGGTNDPSNLVDLTAREHFICHKLLARFADPNIRHKLVYAAWQQGRSLHLKGERLTSHQYEHLRIRLSKELTGKKRAPFSDKARANMSEAHKGLAGPKHSKETRALISSKKKGTNTGADNHFYQKTHSEQFKQEQSVRAKALFTGVKKIRYSCIHCRRELAIVALNKHNTERCTSPILPKVRDTKAAGARASLTKKNKGDVTCPYCNKTGRASSNMTRYHFDNCRLKPGPEQ